MKNIRSVLKPETGGMRLSSHTDTFNLLIKYSVFHDNFV